MSVAPPICDACGSNRILTGPFYSEKDEVCMDCGHRKEIAEINFALSDSEIQEERAQEKMNEAAEVLATELTMEMMQDPEKMKEYLAKLKQATGTLADGPATETPDAPKKSRKRKSPAPTGQGEVEAKAEFGLPAELIWQALHVYLRKAATWQQVLKEARDEKEYRNDNVIMFAHEHSFGEACTDNCRQV